MWQEIPNQRKIQLVLGRTWRRKQRHKRRRRVRKALSRRAAQEVKSVHKASGDSQAPDQPALPSVALSLSHSQDSCQVPDAAILALDTAGRTVKWLL